jgi:pimeloyl-ACP methyl ester carboxylesterase
MSVVVEPERQPGPLLAGLAYEERGSGEPILLIHGHPFDRRMWGPQLEGLSCEARVIAPDLPGYGLSPPRGETMTMRALADSVVGLLDTLGIARTLVIGLSMGGLIAMEIALSRPGRVSGLVLAATTAASVTPEEAASRRATATEIERDGMLPVALEMAGRLFGARARRDPAVLSAVFEMMVSAPPAGAAAALRGRAERPDYATLLPSLDLPVLVLVGDADTYSTREVTAELVGVLPSPQVLKLEGVGHLPNLEEPETFNAAVSAFATAARTSP